MTKNSYVLQNLNVVVKDTQNFKMLVKYFKKKQSLNLSAN